MFKPSIAHQQPQVRGPFEGLFRIPCGIRIANRTLLPASIIGLCHWLFADLEPDETGWFVARMADGDGLAAEDPISALRTESSRCMSGAVESTRPGSGARHHGLERATRRRDAIQTNSLMIGGGVYPVAIETLTRARSASSASPGLVGLMGRRSE
jgi:hypothetical protein